MGSVSSHRWPSLLGRARSIDTNIVNTFSQSTGVMRLSDGRIANCYAGHGDGKNNPFMQGVKNIGPLPQGCYKAITKIEDSHLGPYALHLDPDEATRAEIIILGRDPDSFFCHGDSISHPGDASDGCICAMIQVRQFIWLEDKDIRVNP